MGVLTMEIEKVNKNINSITREQEERQKEAEALAKKKEEQKEAKQAKKDLLIACENDLRASMEEVFSRVTNEDATELTLQCILMVYYKIDTRNECINKFGHSTIEYEHLEKKYDKILNEVYNKYKKHLMYLQSQKQIKLLQEQKEQLEKQEKQQNIIITFKIIKYIILFGLVLVCLPVALIFWLVCELAKSK